MKPRYEFPLYWRYIGLIFASDHDLSSACNVGSSGCCSGGYTDGKTTESYFQLLKRIFFEDSEIKDQLTLPNFFVSFQEVETMSSDTQHFCLRWNNYQSSITSAFESLRDQDDFVDVTLACDGRSLKAHRVVLSACSSYFRELLKVSF